MDILSKIFVPIVVATISVFGAWALARFGIRQKQLQIVELATKRIMFWDTYLKVALQTTQPEGRLGLEQEVGYAIERIRAEAGQQLARLSWSK
ncbi:MAG: hypothetical protein ACRD3Y_07765, partial [Bryobacteraceae bacterium]